MPGPNDGLAAENGFFGVALVVGPTEAMRCQVSSRSLYFLLCPPLILNAPKDQPELPVRASSCRDRHSGVKIERSRHLCIFTFSAVKPSVEETRTGVWLSRARREKRRPQGKGK